MAHTTSHVPALPHKRAATPKPLAKAAALGHARLDAGGLAAIAGAGRARLLHLPAPRLALGLEALAPLRAPPAVRTLYCRRAAQGLIISWQYAGSKGLAIGSRDHPGWETQNACTIHPIWLLLHAARHEPCLRCTWPCEPHSRQRRVHNVSLDLSNHNPVHLAASWQGHTASAP